MSHKPTPLWVLTVFFGLAIVGLALIIVISSRNVHPAAPNAAPQGEQR